MTHTSGTLDGSHSLYWRLWRPDVPGGEVRAAVLLLHGIHEHSGRYAGVASRLMLRGVEVHAVDLRGHGASEGARGYVERFEDYLSDVDRFVEHALASGAAAPRFLLGHSMGGLVAATWWAERQPDALDGLILSSPALALPPVHPLLQAAAPFVSRRLPTLRVQPLDVSKLSRDPSVGRQYQEDPLVTSKGVMARTGYEIQQAAQRLRQRPQAFRAPLYLFHGTDDEIADPEGTARLAREAASDDVTLRLWDGLRHETMNEPERDEVIGAVAEWVLERA
jgi:alpha-beta hydrolase superfamily lysophospholipase